MTRFRGFCDRLRYSVFVCGSVVLLAVSLCDAKDQPSRVNLFPRLKAGQILAYQISYHSDKQTKTKSALIVATPDDSAKIDVNALLLLEVLDVRPDGNRAVIHARTRFETLSSDSRLRVPQFEPPDLSSQKQDTKGKFVEFTMLADGRLSQVTGLDAFFPEQQQAWQEWASRFLLASGLRTTGARVAQRWNSVEKERSPSPITGLRWVRESTYVRDEPCRPVRLTVQGSLSPSDAEPETCAVILTNAALGQDSNAKNVTPEDFKLHELRTLGSARGANRIITYISLKTGLVVRATEEASQEMNVTVAKADGSNRIHYDINAKSRSEVVLVVQTAKTSQ